MSEAVIEDGESGAESAGWTQGNLQKLIASLKDTLPENDKTQNYIRGLKAVDWDKVAFPPFSAGECKEKWNSFMEKMRRFRSLPELLDEAEELLSTPSCKKNIHPDLPKPPYPPKGAYIQKNMSKYARENPGVNAALITKALSEEYEKLSDEYKAEDAKKYLIACEEYNRKIRSFCKDNNLRLPPSKRAKKRKRIVLEGGGKGCGKYKGLPEKPPGHGYALFLVEHSQPGKAGETSHGASFVRVMSQRWKELSENEKQKYNKRCAEMKRKYEAKLMKYLDKLNEEEKKKIIEEKGIKIPKNIPDQYVIQPGEPKMPSQSGFLYFRSDMLKHAGKSMPRKECMEMAQKEWHELSDMKKTRYAEIIQENMKKYTEELQAWFQTLTQKDQRVYLKKKPNAIFLQKYIDESPNLASDSEEEKTSRKKKGRRKKRKL
ncbi:nucleolar transcription factor 1-like isoform X2 [Poeciliopsis prolifica]|uniref:nucleolar transcription factor 1-like isoform X2 n=1 Tax=Poeciliopsis prolifica TaxID=188132 RepID=UPI002413D0ED|nr:nucleolar transcription factor 1-like isoform X2 [Poeciliopsis prolifica]